MISSGLLQYAAFLADAGMTAVAAWLVVCVCGERDRGLLESSLAWWLAFVALVGGAGVILGETGGLGAAGFFAGHAIILGCLVAGRRRHLAEDLAAASRLRERTGRFLTAGGFDSTVAACLLLILALLTVLAAWAEPAVADALTYHLPRIGQWLQDGKVRGLAVQDERMNFVAVVPDLVMAWLLGGTGTGFRPAVLVQAIGGVMTLGATVGLARQTGLGRGASLLAGALLLGMANVAVQFTSAQTDLFTTGIFAAAFYLWLGAMRRGSGSCLGGAGAGLALGAKGTLFYLAPGALVWCALIAWRHPLPRAQWGRTVLAAVGGVMLFALPGFVRNWQLYSDPLGPKEWVSKLHQGALSPADLERKLQWNLTSSLVQVFEPQSQPHGLRAAGRAVAGWLLPHVPEKDPYTLDGLGRRTTFRTVFLDRNSPDADVVSFGAVAFILFSAGSLLALVRWRGEGRLVTGWSAGVLLFLLFFHAMQQWHPYAFRYFLLVAPWIAIVSAWAIEQLKGKIRIAIWVIVLGATVDVGWNVTTGTHQSGWRAVVQPGRSLNYHVASHWGEWSRQLAPDNSPLALCLPEERPLAGFYRQSPGRRISFKRGSGNPALTAEDFVRDEAGWVIVPAARFLGREGQAAARVWLFKGDEGSPYSVAAYRALRPGEKPQAVLYRNRRTPGRAGIDYSFLVKTWEDKPVRLMISNPKAAALEYRLTTPLASMHGEVSAASSALVEIVLTAGVVSEIRLYFDGPVPDGQAEPTVEFIP